VLQRVPLLQCNSHAEPQHTQLRAESADATTCALLGGCQQRLRWHPHCTSWDGWQQHIAPATISDGQQWSTTGTKLVLFVQDLAGTRGVLFVQDLAGTKLVLFVQDLAGTKLVLFVHCCCCWERLCGYVSCSINKPDLKITIYARNGCYQARSAPMLWHSCTHLCSGD
jgi:hypothetical protein